MFIRLHSVLFAFVLPVTAAPPSVLTSNYDSGRTNANLSETILTPGNVGPNTFRQLFTLAVDGQIYAQPLYMPGVSIGGATHNVVFVATMHNSIYAFDADAAALPLWTVNLGPSIPSSTFNPANSTYTDIQPEIGILGTPVIDAATGTLYAVAGTFEHGSVIYRLHALNVTTGAERFGAPTVIAGAVIGIGDSSVDGVVSFVPEQHLQRPGLALSNGILYVGFGSHGDAAPYHGWLFAYSATNTNAQLAVFNPTPNGRGGALWQSGRAPAIDASGNIVVVASNGDTDLQANFSDSVLRLNPNSLSLLDWFAPADYAILSDTDEDLGSMGPILTPDGKYVITGGKQGVLYLLNEGNLGKVNSTDSQIPQEFQPESFGIFNAALWSRSDGSTVFLHGVNGPLQAFALAGEAFSTQPASQSLSLYGAPFQGMTLSANGSRHGTGILWVTTADAALPSTGTLRAYNADDLTSEIWDSGMNAGDAYGQFVKFANPTVVNGRIYVPTGSNQLVIYGLSAGTNPAPVVTGITNAASYAAGSVSPGELVSIFGQNLGPSSVVEGQWSADGSLAEAVDGVEVTFNGIAAPILFVSAGQVAAIVPFELSGSTQASVQVGVNGVLSAPQTLSIANAAPGLFSADSTGSGPGAILNPDYSLNSPSNPAAPGAIVMLYATGGGMTSGQNSAAKLAQTAAKLKAQVSATIGGQPATVLYAGAAPDEVNGMVQVNVQLPPGVSGTVPVALTVGGASSQATVTVSIQ